MRKVLPAAFLLLLFASTLFGAGSAAITPSVAGAGTGGRIFTIDFNPQTPWANGYVTVQIPPGWTTPTTGDTEPGNIQAFIISGGSTTPVPSSSISVSPNMVTISALSLGTDDTLKIVYGAGGGPEGVTVTTATGQYDFYMTEASDGTVNTAQPLAGSPIVTVITVGLDKTANTGNIAAGDTFTYYLNYGNGSTFTAQNVVIWDTIPAGLTYLSSNPAAAVTGPVLSWSLGDVSGAPSTITITTVVSSGAINTELSITNTAMISSDDALSAGVVLQSGACISNVEGVILQSDIYTSPLSTVVTGQLITVYMQISNTGYMISATDVSPSVLAAMNSGLLSLESGPIPVSATIPAGGAAVFTWICNTTGPGTVDFSAMATGNEVDPAGNTITRNSITVTSNSVLIINPTFTVTATMTPTYTITPTLAITPTYTITSTVTPTGTNLPTPSFTPTPGGIDSLISNVVTDGTVIAVAADSSGVYIGGVFTQVGPRLGCGLLVDPVYGAVMSGFPEVAGQSSTSSGINAVIQDGSGGFYIAGDFLYVAGQQRTRLAHILANGSLDPVFNTAGINANVMTLALDKSGYLYLGGSFTQVAAQTRDYFARVNAATGALDGNFNIAADNYVQFFVFDSSTNSMYVAGDFGSIGGQNISYLVNINLTTNTVNTGFNPQAGGTVHAIIEDASGNSLYAAGDFTSIGGLSTQSMLARLNKTTGAADPVFTPVVNNIVQSLALDSTGTNLYIGGWFTTINSTTRNYIAKINTTTAVLDGSFNPNANASVYPLILDGNGNIYAGGSFTTMGGTTRNRVAKMSTTTGALDPNFNPNANNFVGAFAFDNNGNLYMGGDFTSIGGTARTDIAKINAADSSLNTSFIPSLGGEVDALALDGAGNIYAGGQFSGHIAKLNTSTGAAAGTFVVNANNKVDALALDSQGNLYIGGLFTSFNSGSVARNYIAKLNPVNGAVDTNFIPNANGDVLALACDNNGYIYAGGCYTSISGTSCNSIAKLVTSTGAAVGTFNPSISNGSSSVTISAIELDTSGDVYIGGQFNTVNGTASKFNLAAITTGTGANVSSFNTTGADGSISGLALDNVNNIYTGGIYVNMAGSGIGYITKMTTTSGAVDSTFNQYPNIGLNAVCLSPDNATLYAGGGFLTMSKLAASSYAAIHLIAGIATATLTYTVTPTNTPTYTITGTSSATPTFTLTGTMTSSITPTYTPTNTQTNTQTGTPTNTPTYTSSVTYTTTFTQTFTQTSTITVTESATISPTASITATYTISPTYTNTPGPDSNMVLSKNYVNPDKGEKLEISLKTAANVNVKIKVYNLTGEMVRSSLDFTTTADGWNQTEWDVKNDDGKTVGEGLYFVYIQAGGSKKLLKVFVIK